MGDEAVAPYYGAEAEMPQDEDLLKRLATVGSTLGREASSATQSVLTAPLSVARAAKEDIKGGHVPLVHSMITEPVKTAAKFYMHPPDNAYENALSVAPEAIGQGAGAVIGGKLLADIGEPMPEEPPVPRSEYLRGTIGEAPAKPIPAKTGFGGLMAEPGRRMAGPQSSPFTSIAGQAQPKTMARIPLGTPVAEGSAVTPAELRSVQMVGPETGQVHGAKAGAVGQQFLEREQQAGKFEASIDKLKMAEAAAQAPEGASHAVMSKQGTLLGHVVNNNFVPIKGK